MWSLIVSDMHNHMLNASRRPQRSMQTVLYKRPLTTYNMYTENATAVRCALQRLQMCSRATIASSTWNECQLIDIFYFQLAVSIFCHRGRHRCDTVIHACLQPARCLSLKTDLKLYVRFMVTRLGGTFHVYGNSRGGSDVDGGRC